MSEKDLKSSEASVIGENDLEVPKDAVEPTVFVELDYFRDLTAWDEGCTFDSRHSLDFDVQWAEDFFSGEEEIWSGEGKAFYAGEQEEEGEETREEDIIESSKSIHRKSISAEHTTQEQRRRSVYVHSSPMHFPDINKLRKSAFGSVFLRTTGNVAEETALLKSVVDSSFTMVQSLLSTFDKILSSPFADEERKLQVLQNKESLLRTLELHGISKVYSDGNVLWNILPITHDYMFSFQIGEQLHESRYLSRIEERILSGPQQKQMLPYEWPTDSVWTGCWDALGMAGPGTYNMPHGVLYNGIMHDGMFHDKDAVLTYPNQFKALHCVFEKGCLLDCQFQFPDLLMHEKENWSYCQFPDRRFWSEVRRGLKPAKIAQKTEYDPPRNVPKNCYDTGDGFFDPVSLRLLDESGHLLRVPVCSEQYWIKKNCRSGFFEFANYRPDLFENWFNNDKEIINAILTQQDNFRRQKITYDELQTFYAELNLLPPWSRYRKPSRVKSVEYIPSPKKLRSHGHLQNYIRHKLVSSANMDNQSVADKPVQDEISKESKTVSKSSFYSDKKLTNDSKTVNFKRKIPEKFMKYQPVIRQAFQSKASFFPHPQEPEPTWRKCVPRKTSSSSSSDLFMGAEGDTSMLTLWERKHLEKYFKKLIMSRVEDILIKERERHRKRLQWAKPPPEPKSHTKKVTKADKCLKVLQELYHSIPEKSEYCDSDPNRTCDLKAFAEDKYHMVQYWGTRILKLEFDDTL